MLRKIYDLFNMEVKINPSRNLKDETSKPGDESPGPFVRYLVCLQLHPSWLAGVLDDMILPIKKPYSQNATSILLLCGNTYLQFRTSKSAVITELIPSLRAEADNVPLSGESHCQVSKVRSEPGSYQKIPKCFYHTHRPTWKGMALSSETAGPVPIRSEACSSLDCSGRVSTNLIAQWATPLRLPK